LEVAILGLCTERKSTRRGERKEDEIDGKRRGKKGRRESRKWM